MERRFAARMQEALDDAIVDPRVFCDVQPRLENFLEPFVACLQEAEQKAHARSYVTGLLSDLKRKNVESVAYLHDQERLPLQKFIGCSPWGHQPLLGELARQIGAELGEADGVIVFDPSARVNIDAITTSVGGLPARDLGLRPEEDGTPLILGPRERHQQRILCCFVQITLAERARFVATEARSRTAFEVSD